MSNPRLKLVPSGALRDVLFEMLTPDGPGARCPLEVIALSLTVLAGEFAVESDVKSATNALVCADQVTRWHRVLIGAVELDNDHTNG